MYSNKIGILHALSEETKLSVLIMPRKGPKEARVYDQYALKQYHKEKQRKMDIMR